MSHPGILQLISSSGFYGAERVLLELALHLRDQGWPCHVGALQAPHMKSVALVREARRRGLPTMLFPCRGGFDTHTISRIRDYSREQGIRVIHTHGYKSDIYAFLARASDLRLVATCHNWLTDSLKLMFYELLDKLTLHRFDGVVGVSPPLEREIASAGIHKGTLIDNGLALEATLSAEQRDTLRRSLGVTPDQTMLLAIGRLDRWKAYDQLLEAVARLGANNTIRLVLVGDGDLQGDLERQARELGIEQQVNFTGYRTDVGQLLLAADLFVISSRKEGLPMVLLEAMAAGLPVVATRVGAIPEAVEHGAEGLLVPAEDPDALATAIAELLTSRHRRRELGDQALATHRRRFSRQAMGRRYEALYTGLLHRGEP